MTDSDLVFLDCETLGLDPEAPIWEFAAIRRFPNGGGTRAEFFIRHDPGHWLDTLDKPFREDYEARYDKDDAVDEHDAAIMIDVVTAGAIAVVCNPLFDLPRLEALLRHYDITQSWHYHPLDVPSMVHGFICGGKGVGRGHPPEQPWKSDRLSTSIGVDPADFARHTAMGDVEWILAQYEEMTGTAS